MGNQLWGEAPSSVHQQGTKACFKLEKAYLIYVRLISGVNQKYFEGYVK